MDTTKPPPPQLPHQKYVNVTSKFNMYGKKISQRDTQKPRMPCPLDDFKKLVNNIASGCAKTKSLSSTQTSILQHHLDQFFLRVLKTPDHPPYETMIKEAIEQLNKKEGSSKELISSFIKENYKDLPCAHNGMLEHHLSHLSSSGHLVITDDGHYLFANRASKRSSYPSCSPALSVDTSYRPISSSRRTKSSVKTLGRSSQRDELFVSSEVDSATKHGLMSQGEKEKEVEEGSTEVQEHEHRKKRGRMSCGESSFNGKRKKITTMHTRVAGRGRGRPPKKVVLQVSEGKKCSMTEDKSGVAEHETKSPDGQNVDIEKLKEVTRAESVVTECDMVKGSTSQGEEENNPKEGSTELKKQGNQKKRGRKSCGEGNFDGKRKKTATIETRVAGRGRGRPPKKVVHQVSEEKSCLMTEDKSGVANHETKALDDQNVDIEKLKEVTGGESVVTGGESVVTECDDKRNTEEMVKQQNISDASRDEVIEKDSNHIDYVNELFGDQTNLLYLLPDLACGEFLPDQEHKEEEVNMRIEVLDTHEAITETPKKGRGRPPKIEKGVQLKPPGENDALKMKRKLQDPYEERNELKKKQVLEACVNAWTQLW